MDDINMREILEHEFKDDPIYKLCLVNKLEKHLFTESILALETENSYSTVEAGRILGRNDSTIRNHFRTDLIEYVAPERYGKYYRMDYISMFKLQMIIVLMEKAGKSSIDILVEAGFQASELTTSSNQQKKTIRQGPVNEVKVIHQQNNNEEFEERLSNVEQHLSIQSIQIAIVKYEKDIAEYKLTIAENMAAINEIKNVEQMKYLQDKQDRLLTSTMRKSFKKGMFGFLKKEDLDVALISKEIDSELKAKSEQIIKDKIEVHLSKIEEAKQKLEQIKSQLKIEQNKLSLNHKDVKALEETNTM